MSGTLSMVVAAMLGSRASASPSPTAVGVFVATARRLPQPITLNIGADGVTTNAAYGGAMGREQVFITFLFQVRGAPGAHTGTIWPTLPEDGDPNRFSRRIHRAPRSIPPSRTCHRTRRSGSRTIHGAAMR